jgi:type I restriction enzyme, S subunit
MSNTRGSSQPFVSYDMLYEILSAVPIDEVAIKFNVLAKIIFKQINLSQKDTKS